MDTKTKLDTKKTEAIAKLITAFYTHFDHLKYRTFSSSHGSMSLIRHFRKSLANIKNAKDEPYNHAFIDAIAASPKKYLKQIFFLLGGHPIALKKVLDKWEHFTFYYEGERYI